MRGKIFRILMSLNVFMSMTMLTYWFLGLIKEGGLGNLMLFVLMTFATWLNISVLREEWDK